MVDDDMRGSLSDTDTFKRPRKNEQRLCPPPASALSRAATSMNVRAEFFRKPRQTTYSSQPRHSIVFFFLLEILKTIC